jgi:hypothetical protein
LVLVAAFLGVGEARAVAEQVERGGAEVDGDGVSAAIDGEGDVRVGGAVTDGSDGRWGWVFPGWVVTMCLWSDDKPRDYPNRWSNPDNAS